MNPDTGEIRAFESRKEAEHAGFTAALSEEMAREMRKLSAAERMERVRSNRHISIEPPPTGNGPCPCGSGRKYKKCCMKVTA